MTNFGQIYKAWTAKTTPSKTTARMTRTTMKYVASGHGATNWEDLPLLPREHCLVLLDAAMASQDLTSQSRSHYRGYLRCLCRFIEDEGIDAPTDANGRIWPSMPNNIGVGKRAGVAGWRPSPQAQDVHLVGPARPAYDPSYGARWDVHVRCGKSVGRSLEV